MSARALLLLLLVGCAAASRDELASAPVRADLSWARDVEAAHRAADATTDPRAQERLLEAARARVPDGALGDEDGRRILQDLQFRLAMLALDAGDGERARAEARRGLTLGTAEDEFVANLLIVDGRAASQLGEAGEAAKAYGKAMRIHEHLLERALRGVP